MKQFIQFAVIRFCLDLSKIFQALTNGCISAAKYILEGVKND